MANEIPVVIDPSLGVDPAALKAAWGADPDARQLGRLETRPSTQEFAGFLELVLVGVAVKVTADLVTEAIKKLAAALAKGPVAVEKQTVPGGKEAVVVQKK